MKEFQLLQGYLIVKFQEKDEVKRITYWNSFINEATQRGKVK